MLCETPWELCLATVMKNLGSNLQSGKKYLNKMALLLVCAGYMASGREESVTTADIPVPLGGISAVCHVLCPAAFEQDI